MENITYSANTAVELPYFLTATAPGARKRQPRLHNTDIRIRNVKSLEGSSREVILFFLLFCSCKFYIHSGANPSADEVRIGAKK